MENKTKYIINYCVNDSKMVPITTNNEGCDGHMRTRWGIQTSKINDALFITLGWMESGQCVTSINKPV